ncbi:MAG: hypothetical protein ACI9LV_000873 [Candidatus Nanohaloarchaea archaeon]|jgi:hypothetical protein
MSAAKNGDTFTMAGEAETHPEGKTNIGEAELELEDSDLVVELSDFPDQKVPFDEAVESHETDEFREIWGDVQKALEEEVSDEFDLTPGDHMLRGFGGGMMTVVEGEDSLKLYGPQRDFGASAKGMIDISAGRSTTGGGLENWYEQAENEFEFEDDILEKYEDELLEESGEEDWESLLVREGAEEIVFTSQNENGENILHVPEYGDEEIDSIVHKAVLQEFLKAKNGAKGFGTDERSHLHDKDFKVETYEASAEAPENAAQIILEDFYGEDYEFEAGLVPEFESSSLEGVLLNVIDEEDLPADYSPQDTETVDIGDDYVHLDRTAYEMEIDEGGVSVNLYEEGELSEELTLEEYVDEMDREFERYLDSVTEDLGDYDSEELMEEVGEEYGSSFATVKVLEGLEALKDRAPEYEESIQQAYNELSRKAEVRSELPWAGGNSQDPAAS